MSPLSKTKSKTTKLQKAAPKKSDRATVTVLPNIDPKVEWKDCDPADLDNHKLFINREASLLSFHQRVLDQAKNEEFPLLERVKFLAILGTNLNEVCMIRIAILLHRMRSGAERVAMDGLTTQQVFVQIRKKTTELLHEQGRYWAETLRPLLAQESIHFLDHENYSKEVKTYLSEYYHNNLHKGLTPLAFDPGRPFPHISNLSLNLAVVVRHNGLQKFARVKIPDIFPRFIRLPPELFPDQEVTFVFLEDIIKDNISALFCDVEIVGVHMFRIARDTNLELQEDDSDDILETINEGLEQLRYGNVTLLQVEESTPEQILGILAENFEIGDGIIDRIDGRLGFDDWFELMSLHKSELRDAPIKRPILFHRLEFNQVLERIKQRDYLTHHPYESFEVVERFLEGAAMDPQVIAIKMTLYRVDKNSPILDYLIQASQEGKQVSVLVELKARFDESNNINWARRLEAHGIHVAYGLLKLKTHCKLCLVLRQERDGIRSYMHIGTGNYNGKTSKVYTDLGLLTSNADIGSDVTEVFNSLTGYSNRKSFDTLMVAPMSLRQGIIEMIEREIEHAKAGKEAHLIFKVNSLEDKGVIQMLFKASQAGVKIDLIIRGLCCMRPGIPGISDNIRIISIVGRFLEHSRVYYFANGGNDEIYFGSSDLMERNLNRRVETLCPILDETLKTEIKDKILEVMLKDNQQAYLLQTNGNYERLKCMPPEAPINAQEEMIRYYSQRES